MDWNQFFTGLLPLLGVVVGGLTTYFTQNNVEKKKTKRELKKEKEVRNIERLEIYTKILKLNGELITHVYIGGENMSFYPDTYQEQFRPILYSKFYLLDQDIADIVKEMDSIIIHAEHRTHSIDKSIMIEERNELFDLFNELINNIEIKLKEYRQETFKKYS